VSLLRVIPPVLDQHCEEAAFLWTLRQTYLTRADISLAELADLDERIDAHLAGIRAAQEHGWAACRQALADAGSGEIFAAATLALEADTSRRLTPLLAAVHAEPSLWPGLVGAFGWASPRDLLGTVKDLLASDSRFLRRVGMASCIEHRVNPGTVLAAACTDADADLGMLALRAVGEFGRLGLLQICMDQLDVDDGHRAFWAARSAVLLGDRARAIDTLLRLGLPAATLPAPLRRCALQLALQAMDMARGHELLKTLRGDFASRRLMIQCVGVLGNARYAPWLLKQMENTKLSRVAGEAFRLVTSADISAMQLRRELRPTTDEEPDDDPCDAKVAMHEDASLPWPDSLKIAAWWQDNGSRFVADKRRLLGEAPTISRCLDILRTGTQRHRDVAAQTLCLLQPATIFFNIAAPTWRQHRMLDLASTRDELTKR
jgi:uncharacterized protein (TIGR02270 family)